MTSLIGTWMQNIAQAWLVYRLTNSALLLGLVGFAGQIPVFLCAPIGGVVADRWNRHRIVIGTQTASMILAFILAALTLFHIAVIAGLLAMKLGPLRRSVKEAPPLEHIAEGFRYVWRTAPIRALLLLIGLVSLIAVPYSVLMPLPWSTMMARP